jgi:hypothetical protein
MEKIKKVETGALFTFIDLPRLENETNKHYMMRWILNNEFFRNLIVYMIIREYYRQFFHFKK